MSAHDAACAYCGRRWLRKGRPATRWGVTVAMVRLHASRCRLRSPAQRRAANAKAQARWAMRPPKTCLVWNDPKHPGMKG